MACYSWLKTSEDSEDAYSQDEALGRPPCAVTALSRPVCAYCVWVAVHDRNTEGHSTLWLCIFGGMRDMSCISQMWCFVYTFIEQESVFQHLFLLPVFHGDGLPLVVAVYTRSSWGTGLGSCYHLYPSRLAVCLNWPQGSVSAQWVLPNWVDS